MNKRFIAIICGAELAAAALVFLAAHILSVYSFGSTVSLKVFIGLAVALAVAGALLALVLFVVDRKKPFLNRKVLAAFPAAFIVSEVISYLFLALIGVIAWKREGNIAETGFASLILFVIVSIVLSLLMTFACAMLIERKEAN
ncbi:MAG: hypothetical protein IKI64_02090 [Clostridia bacterium]|nr:hypothetical protein [Clostridia bacterium]